MRKLESKPSRFLLTLVFLLLAGCAGAPEPVRETPKPQPIQDLVKEGQAPKWITQKGAAFTDRRAVFYGVGNAAGLVNPSLKRRAAEAAARRDLAQEFQVYIAALQKQYVAETTGGSMDRHSVEQRIEDVMKQVTEQTLVGSSIIEYWEHPSRNEAYALARLDLAGFHATLRKYRSATAQATKLDAEVKEFAQDNADEMHDRVRHEQRERVPRSGPAVSPAIPTREDQREPAQMPPPKGAGPAVPGGSGASAPEKPVPAPPGGSESTAKPSSLPRPDPATFQTGDILWPRQPWMFIPFNSQPSGSYDPDKAEWEREKLAFLNQVKQNPQPSEHDRVVAADLQNLTYEEFRARFLSGIDEDEVTAAGWAPWIGHVAVIYVKDDKPFVVESTFGGTRMMTYDDWLKERGKSLIWHGRVRELDAAGRARLGEDALKQLKKPYQFFNFDLSDDSGFYCSKFAWFLIRRATGIAADDDPNPRRKFWFSPKQLIRSPHVRLLTNPTSYSGSDDRVEPQSLEPRTGPPAETAVIPSLTDRRCETAFSQCLTRCKGPDLESCTESCCCQLGGKQCPSAPDCCPAR